MKIKLKLILFLGLLPTIFPLSLIVQASTWSGNGPGDVTVLDGTTSNPQLQYGLKGQDSWSKQIWKIHAIAEADGEIELHYLYEGFPDWYRVRVFLDAYVTEALTKVLAFLSMIPRGA